MKDLTGMRFGRLVCESHRRGGKENRVLWSCRCDCGGRKEVRGRSLESGNTSSCGCFHREVAAKTMTVPFDERYVAIPESGCWLWLGGWSPDGYGLMGGRSKTGHKLAHRYSYSVHIGPIPNGMLVMHKCDTPACINPSHLQVGTNADNVRDRDQKGRTNKKLTDEQVREIWKSSESHSKLAKKYGLAVGTIHFIKHERKVWS